MMSWPLSPAFSACSDGRAIRARRGICQETRLSPLLSTLLAPKFIVVYVFVASALYVHFRGRVRHRFVRQLKDHSTIMAPYNTLMYLFSAVPPKPFVDVHKLPELAKLRENWQVMRDEALALMGEGQIRAATGHNDLGFNSFFKEGWKRFYLKWYGAPLPSAQALCPKTVALVQSLPSVNAAMFALLPPGGKLNRHRDPFAGSLRYHLGLVTPNSDDCRIYIDGEAYSWRDGQDVLFDETFIHSAENKTDVTRIILFCDVEQRSIAGSRAISFERRLPRTSRPSRSARSIASTRCSGAAAISSPGSSARTGRCSGL